MKQNSSVTGDKQVQPARILKQEKRAPTSPAWLLLLGSLGLGMAKKGRKEG